MSGIKISNLPASTTPLSGSEIVPLVQGGVTKRATVTQIGTVTATGSTTARTLPDRFADVVSVKDFGALGDGIPDDTTAINAAIESLGATGGTVYFPPGTYMVGVYTPGPYNQNFGIVLKSNLTLAGAGVNATIIKGMPNAGKLTLVGNDTFSQSNITICDLTLDHNGLNLNAPSGCNVLELRVVDNVWINRIAVKNSDQHGILTLAAPFPGGNTASLNNNYFVTDCYFENIGVSGRNGGDALRLFYGAAKITVNNIIANKVEHHGVHVGNGVGTISNIQIINPGVNGLDVQSEGVLANNIHVVWDDVISDLFANRPAAGTMGRLFWASDITTWYRDNGVSWKQVTSGTLEGIRLVTRTPGAEGTWPQIRRVSVSNVKLIANMTQNEPYTQTFGDGFRVDGPEIQISNAHIVGPFRYGIFAATGNLSDNLQVSGVTIDGVRWDGIRIEEVDNPMLHQIAILSAGTEAGTRYGINLRRTQNTKITSSYINDASLSAGVREEIGTERGTKVIGSQFTKASMTGSIGGAFNNIIDCSGFITNNNGTATITASTTSVTVTHGLSATPAAANISVTPTNSEAHGNLYITSITSTQFTINCTSAPASNLTLSWAARPA